MTTAAPPDVEDPQMTTACPTANVLPERFAICVTANDIEQGWPCSGNKCPIALAMTRWLRERQIAFVAVTVTDRDIEINLNWHTPALRYWHDATSFTVMFDRDDGSVEPRTVVLARLPRPGEPSHCRGAHGPFQAEEPA